MQPQTPRLRFAPSPTGYLHVGGARTALFNWLYARKYGGAFLLRVEDTDKARSTEESTQAIFDGLRWLGLDWDEDVVFQGAHASRHYQDAHRLLEAGLAYRDFTTTEELASQRAAAESRGETFVFDRQSAEIGADDLRARLEQGDPFTIRFRVPPGETTWNDLVHGPITFPNKDIDDFIILRSDGSPIYNLAVVSDDIAMGITVVMRGDDHISNTPKQILLYRALGASLPQFAHLPVILGEDGKKLSKRRNAVAVADYSGMGILPQAMRNFLALLGWSPGDDREVLDTAEMIDLFSSDALLKKASVFDTKKLEWMNGQHMTRMPIADFDAIVRPALIDSGVTSDTDLRARQEWWHQLIELLRIRSRTTTEFVSLALPYFRDDVTLDEQAMAKHWKDPGAVRTMLHRVRERLALAPWTAEALEESLRTLAAELGVSAGKLFQPLRVALTGAGESPGMFDVLLLLGRERCLHRLTAAVERLTP